MPNDLSVNQGYQLPHPDNVARADASRIRAALEAVDLDVFGLLAAVAAKTDAAYVDAAIANLVAASPAALDTLNELAAAMGDDPNFATSMTNALAAKAALAHLHAIADVTGLQAELDSKSASGHNHDLAYWLRSEIASQAAAEAGADDATLMTPERTAQAIAALAGSGAEVGSSIIWHTATPPTGYLECDGAAVSRTTYAGLFAVLGSAYGAGDGSTTFNLPDLRGEFLRGWANGQTTDPDRANRTDRGDGVTGDSVGTKQSDQYKNHTHTYQRTTYTGNQNSYSEQSGNPSDTSGSTGSSGGNETRPRNTYVMFCIKY